jgi:hypothetical protein
VYGGEEKVMEGDIQVIIDLIKSTYGAAAGGALAAISVAVYGLVKVLRLSVVQALLGKISPKLQWEAWPKWLAALVVFLLTAVGAFLAALAAGTAWLPALIGALGAALPVALAAMGVDAAVGTVITKPEPAPHP